MLLSTVHLRDVSRWGRGDGLEILLIAVGAVLIVRFAHWTSSVYRGRIEDEIRQQIQQGGVASEHGKRARTVSQVVEWGVVALVCFIAGLLILNRFGIPLTSLVAPATVAGAAIGFGAQQVVQDLLAGFFLFAERQFAVGDVIRFSQPGQTTGVTGTVEELTLRVTKVRTLQGELVFIPNGALRQVTNLSKEWARAVVDIPIRTDEDLNQATAVLRQVSSQMAHDPDWESDLMGEPVVAGVESIEVGYVQLRLIARTLPGKQSEVGRELRLRAATALQQAGIAPPAMQVHVPAS